MADNEKLSAQKANVAETVASSSTNVTYGIPLIIERKSTGSSANTYRVYVCLMNSHYKFSAETIQGSRYGWVTMVGSGTQFVKPTIYEYWKYNVYITKTGSTQDKILNGASGHLVEHPYFTSHDTLPEGKNTVTVPGAPHIKEATGGDIVTYYVDRHDKWRSTAPAQYRGRLLRSIPRFGWEKDAYQQGKTHSDGISVRQNLADTWAETKAGLKGVSNVGGMYRDLKKGFIKDNLLVQEGNSLTLNDRNGNVIEKKDKVSIKATFRGADYPRLNPERFKMAGKRFNKLLSTAPSTILKPINTWIKSVSDVEIFALAGLASIAQVLSLGTAFKPLDSNVEVPDTTDQP